MFGEHNVTCHNKGMSYFYLGKLKAAKECFERSVELDEVCMCRGAVLVCCTSCAANTASRLSRYLRISKPNTLTCIEAIPTLAADEVRRENMFVVSANEQKN